MAERALERWASSLLTRLHIQENPENLRMLVGWAKAEGGHFNNDAKYNVLNTTQPEPGAGNTGTQGNIKVYRNWDQGLKATVQTLKNGRYGGILHALKSGSVDDFVSAIGSSPWGTSADLVGRVVHATPRIRPGTGGNLGGGGGGGGGGSTGPTYRTIAGADNSAVRQQLLQQYVVDRGKPDALANLGFALQGAQDTPSRQVQTSGGRYLNSGPTGSVKAADPSSMPTGTAHFEGKTVAAWIKPALVYARKNGWKGTVTSGFRSFEEQTRIYNSGVRPAARPGHSNHEGSEFPRGAVDVSDAQSLANILHGTRWGRVLKWAGSKDPVHFSHPHDGGY